jgi:hypothetical protein
MKVHRWRFDNRGTDDARVGFQGVITVL